LCVFCPDGQTAGIASTSTSGTDLTMNEPDDAAETLSSKVTLIAKFAKERIAMEELDCSMTIGQVKNILWEKTRVLPKRQKLVGLLAIAGGAKGVHDDLPLSDLKKSKSGKAAKSCQFEFILMGTPEEYIFVDPNDREDLPDVLDDFDLDFNAGSTEWLQHKVRVVAIRCGAVPFGGFGRHWHCKLLGHSLYGPLNTNNRRTKTTCASFRPRRSFTS
jgi:hypothetical protein